MRKVLLPVLALFLLGGCISQGTAELSNWPDGHSSAVAITFETEQATGDQLQSLVTLLEEKGAKATFFVIAGYYENNPKDLDPLKESEVANMGWYQTNWDRVSLPFGFQSGEVKKAHEWLTDAGFEVTGFRAPFLKNNPATYEVIKELGYAYDSSEYYGFSPYMVGNIVEIPLSVNYDLYWDTSSAEVSTLPAYIAFQKSHEEAGLFTFYGHASTTSEQIAGFEELLDFVREKNVWFATGSEVADWWVKKEGLEVKTEGTAVMVKNNGDESVSGATLRVEGSWNAVGAVDIKKDGDFTYIVVPDIDAGATVAVGLKKR
ncbi:MAG: polysaccharide deacetylase family protein [Desulfatiglandales bacterium]